jgi:hypothetical protein
MVMPGNAVKWTMSTTKGWSSTSTVSRTTGQSISNEASASIAVEGVGMSSSTTATTYEEYTVESSHSIHRSYTSTYEYVCPPQFGQSVRWYEEGFQADWQRPHPGGGYNHPIYYHRGVFVCVEHFKEPCCPFDQCRGNPLCYSCVGSYRVRPRHGYQCTNSRRNLLEMERPQMDVMGGIVSNVMKEDPVMDGMSMMPMENKKDITMVVGALQICEECQECGFNGLDMEGQRSLGANMKLEDCMKGCIELGDNCKYFAFAKDGGHCHTFETCNELNNKSTQKKWARFIKKAAREDHMLRDDEKCYDDFMDGMVMDEELKEPESALAGSQLEAAIDSTPAFGKAMFLFVGVLIGGAVVNYGKNKMYNGDRVHLLQEEI